MTVTAKTDASLVALLDHLKGCGYQFVTPTPTTHARVLTRTPKSKAQGLRDVFGWNRPFDATLLDGDLRALLHAADAVVSAAGGHEKSRYRVSSVGPDLLLHSAYPTDDTHAVFFGPDSYRFANLIRAELADLPRREGARLVDMGTGSGVGAIVAARACPELHITMTDINPDALRLARINAKAAGVPAQFIHCRNLDGMTGSIDIAIANPPYIIDPSQRHYRDGGDMHGAGVSYQMAAAALDRLAPGGRLILYTGSPIIGGQDRLHEALSDLAARHGCAIRYDELDPDVFGEELDTPAYRDVERIAIVSAVIAHPG